MVDDPAGRRRPVSPGRSRPPLILTTVGGLTTERPSLPAGCLQRNQMMARNPVTPLTTCSWPNQQMPTRPTAWRRMPSGGRAWLDQRPIPRGRRGRPSRRRGTLSFWTISATTLFRGSYGRPDGHRWWAPAMGSVGRRGVNARFGWDAPGELPVTVWVTAHPPRQPSAASLARWRSSPSFPGSHGMQRARAGSATEPARSGKQPGTRWQARADTENPTRRAPHLAEGRVPGLTPIGSSRVRPAAGATGVYPTLPTSDRGAWVVALGARSMRRGLCSRAPTHGLQ
jgi:hypothetical protein